MPVNHSHRRDWQREEPIKQLLLLDQWSQRVLKTLGPELQVEACRENLLAGPDRNKHCWTFARLDLVKVAVKLLDDFQVKCVGAVIHHKVKDGPVPDKAVPWILLSIYLREHVS